MAARNINRISQRTREILATAVVNVVHVTFPQPVPAREWNAVQDAMNGMGGFWQLSKGFKFDADPTALIAKAVDDGVVPAPARTSEGYVRTPDRLAAEVVAEFSGLKSAPAGVRVLEPAAGDGSLVQAILAASPQAEVWAVDPDRVRARQCGDVARKLLGRERVWDMHTGGLRHAGERAPRTVTVLHTSIEHVAERCRNEIRSSARPWFDVVVMNPPYALPGNQTVWIDHVLLAYEMLRPGGRLVAIVPASVATRQDRKHREIRELVERLGGIKPLPARSFAVSGTTLDTAVIWLDKPDADGRLPYVFRTYRGDEEPVQVDYLDLDAPGAIENAPVQVWYDAWRSTDRVLRYAARCATCPRQLWAFDDGENDPRGATGEHSAGFSIDPTSYDMTGPRIGFCSMCGGEQYNAAVDKAMALWTPAKPAVDDLDDTLAAVLAEMEAELRAALTESFGPSVLTS